MSREIYPILMFAVLFVLLALGVPIAFSLTAVAVVFAFFFWGVGGLNLIVSAAWGAMNNFVIVAVPLFIFMAYILQKTNVVEDFYDSIYKWSGGARGGLAIATILVGAILGAVSGVVAAGVIGLGLIGLPQMLKHKYGKNLSLGSVLAGGTLGQLIPPSTNMVLYGCVTGVSIGSLFAGGISAGVFLAALYIIYISIRGLLNRDLCPALPADERASWSEKFIALKGIILPTLLILIVLGSILFGIATPTEGAAFGAGGAMLIGCFKRRINWKIISSSCYETLLVSTMVGWTMVGAASFSAVFSGLGGNTFIIDLAMNIPGGPNAVFAVSAVFIFVLGMFLEPGAIIFLAVPILAPILTKMGFDGLWVGLAFNILLQCGYLSPPFGLSLFYLKGCAPDDISLGDVYQSSLPFLAIQVVCVAIIFIFPQIVLWLPRVLLGA